MKISDIVSETNNPIDLVLNNPYSDFGYKIFFKLFYYFNYIGNFNATEVFNHVYRNREWFNYILFAINCRLLNQYEMSDQKLH